MSDKTPSGREAFEKWASDHYATLVLDSWNVNYYGDRPTAAAFEAWQAGRAEAREEAAKACDEVAARAMTEDAQDAARLCAAAVRARGGGAP